MKRAIVILLVFMLSGCKKAQTRGGQIQIPKQITSSFTASSQEAVSHKSVVEKNVHGGNIMLLKQKSEIRPQEAIKMPIQKQPTQDVKEKRILPPKIKYISSHVETKGKSNVISVGEKITLNITIKNIGEGPANDASAKINTDNNIIPDFNVLYLPSLAPGETKVVSIGFFISNTAPKNVIVKLEFSEGTEIDIPLTINQKPVSEKQKGAIRKELQMENKEENAFKELEEEAK